MPKRLPLVIQQKLDDGFVNLQSRSLLRELVVGREGELRIRPIDFCDQQGLTTLKERRQLLEVRGRWRQADVLTTIDLLAGADIVQAIVLARVIVIWPKTEETFATSLQSVRVAYSISILVALLAPRPIRWENDTIAYVFLIGMLPNDLLWLEAAQGGSLLRDARIDFGELPDILQQLAFLIA